MEQVLKEKLELFAAQYPKFADGRIDYSHAHDVAAVVVFVMYDEKLLLLKRSDQVRSYKNKWDVIAGFYDEFVEPEEKALEELREEAGIVAEDIELLKPGKLFARHDEALNGTFYNVPVLVRLKTQKEIVLDFEHTEYAWTTFDQLKNYDLSVQFSAEVLDMFE